MEMKGGDCRPHWNSLKQNKNLFFIISKAAIFLSFHRMYKTELLTFHKGNGIAHLIICSKRAISFLPPHMPLFIGSLHCIYFILWFSFITLYFITLYYYATFISLFWNCEIQFLHYCSLIASCGLVVLALVQTTKTRTLKIHSYPVLPGPFQSTGLTHTWSMGPRYLWRCLSLSEVQNLPICPLFQLYFQWRPDWPPQGMGLGQLLICSLRALLLLCQFCLCWCRRSRWRWFNCIQKLSLPSYCLIWRNLCLCLIWSMLFSPLILKMV